MTFTFITILLLAIQSNRRLYFTGPAPLKGGGGVAASHFCENKKVKNINQQS